MITILVSLAVAWALTLSLGGPPKDHPSRSSWLKNENLSASPRPRRCARAHPVERGLPRQLGGRGTHSPCEARGLWQVRVDMQLSSGRFWSMVNMGRFQRTIARCATPQPLPHARRASSSYILLTCPFCTSRMSTRARKCMKLIVSRLGWQMSGHRVAVLIFSRHHPPAGAGAVYSFRLR